MKVQAFLSFLLLAVPAAAQDRTIRVPRDPQISPDGTRIAFAWRGDVWTAPARGGDAVRLTTHPKDDASPCWSPDGKAIAFVSDRSGAAQVWIVGAAGGAPRQVTHDSHAKRLLGFMPNGAELLMSIASDRSPHGREAQRLFAVDLAGEKPKRMLFDAGAADGTVSPDGQKVLFTRGRSAWWRKGYRGSQAAQLWLADLTTTPVTLTRLDEDRPQFQNVAAFFPMWAPDGASYWYVSDPDGTFDIWFRRLDGGEPARVTDVSALDHSDDGVAFPSVSTDGKSIVFRRRFDLVHLDVATGELSPIELRTTGDSVASALERINVDGADRVVFTEDGKQIALVAGEDVWVMDRILKEPVRVTDTAHEETSVAFSADGKRLFFVSDAGGEADIWEATHAREDGVWWLAESFSLRQVTDDRAVESGLRLSPSGAHVAYVKNNDLFVMDSDGTDHRRVVESWSRPEFDWSPDGKWLVYANQDSDYNSDVWVVPLDGTRAPFNLSRHPDRDSDPVWSGDGKRIAFVSQRAGDERDVYWIDLTKEEHEKTDRDRKLAEAIEAMQKGKKKSPRSASGDTEDDEKKEEKKDEKKAKTDAVEVHVDFDGIHDRMHRIAIPTSYESGLIWSPDGKKLAFQAVVGGERGLYVVEFPDVGKPKKLAGSGLDQARWLEQGNEIVGLGAGRTPAAMSASGKLETFGFSVRQVRDWQAVRRISFDQAWRAMRDRFYDESLNHRDWDAVRAKYRPVAGQCLGREEFSDVVNMMLGELNASHMGHGGGQEPLPDVETGNEWTPTTYHLGLRFELAQAGPGLRVESVIPGSPCHQERSRVEPGETLLAIDGQKVGPDVDLDRLLTMDVVRDLELTIADREGKQREVTVRPTRSVSGLLYDEWVESNRRVVEELSEGRLGYLHIRGMNMWSFRQMEADLYDAGHGKDGLIIDVRFNGGGSTTDHVMTALTQPVHAITKSRGSGEGYPQDRRVYASWTKPIVLMCNEHSFSNAEILSHAVKQAGRGRLVGMRTAGGVISTGSQRLLDGSYVRMPTRGWYLVTSGEDMELNGCLPHIALWNPPDSDEDLQLRAAVEALAEDVAAEKAKGSVRIEPASSRRQREARGR